MTTQNFANKVVVTKDVKGHYTLWVSLTGDKRMDLSAMGGGVTIAAAFQHPVWLRYEKVYGAPTSVVHHF